LALDPVGLAQDVEAQAGPLAGIRRQQAAEHSQRRGLARAVGAQEAADATLFDLDRQVLDDVLGPEALVQPGDVDGQGHGPGSSGTTSTGWPGLRRTEGRA